MGNACKNTPNTTQGIDILENNYYFNKPQNNHQVFKENKQYDSQPRQQDYGTDFFKYSRSTRHNFYDDGDGDLPKHNSSKNLKQVKKQLSGSKPTIFEDKNRNDINRYQPNEKLVTSHIFLRQATAELRKEPSYKNDDINEDANFKEFFNHNPVTKSNLMTKSHQLPNPKNHNFMTHSNFKMKMKHSHNFKNQMRTSNIRNRGEIRESTFENLPDYERNNQIDIKVIENPPIREEDEFDYERQENQFPFEKTLTLNNGAKYTGELQYGLPAGEGKEVYRNGDHYEGQYKMGQRDGEGRFEKKGEFIYIGSFKNNEFFGKGQKIFKDGRKFEGEFKNGKEEGHGVMQDSSGNEIQRGIWINGFFYQ